MLSAQVPRAVNPPYVLATHLTTPMASFHDFSLKGRVWTHTGLYVCRRDIPYFAAKSKSWSPILPLCPSRKFSKECVNAGSPAVCLPLTLSAGKGPDQRPRAVRERSQASPRAGENTLGKIRAKQCDEFLNFCQNRKHRDSPIFMPLNYSIVNSHLN